MSTLWKRNRSTYKFYDNRSITSYPIDRIYKEVAFIAYYFHWSHDEVMNMEHRERRRWCDEISKINSDLNDEPKNIFSV
ncbi:DUF6760 family protein [uncultured Clostridium sp.]|uniref:DUF6760 family protein n=1 Tax=uncultured Clostridium sp. TaxID=59620 RepID=UPI00345C01BE